MVFEESLRLYPPAWAVGRKALADDVVLGYRIPAGSMIAVSPYVLHRHPKFWDEPERFDPERFSAERSARRQPFVYIPFGAGPRQCIGNHFAMQEAIIALSMISRRYRMKTPADDSVVVEPHVTLRPKDGLQAVIEPRTRSPWEPKNAGRR
jgi:cytochrome P450